MDNIEIRHNSKIINGETYATRICIIEDLLDITTGRLSEMSDSNCDNCLSFICSECSGYLFLNNENEIKEFMRGLLISTFCKIMNNTKNKYLINDLRGAISILRK